MAFLNFFRKLKSSIIIMVINPEKAKGVATAVRLG